MEQGSWNWILEVERVWAWYLQVFLLKITRVNAFQYIQAHATTSSEPTGLLSVTMLSKSSKTDRKPVGSDDDATKIKHPVNCVILWRDYIIVKGIKQIQNKNKILMIFLINLFIFNLATIFAALRKQIFVSFWSII